MDEKRLTDIERRVNAIQYVFNGWDMVPLTIAEANELTAEIRRLREALAFYGDKKNHCLRFGRDAEHFFKGSEVAYDMGKRARAALGLEK